MEDLENEMASLDTTTAPAAQTGTASKRARGQTAMDFKSAATGVSAKAMRNELNAMIQGIDDPDFKKAFEAEMQSFFILFNRYLAERAKGQKIDWDKIQPPSPEQVVPYSDLPESTNKGELLNKLAVLKLNGGLGTTMGCVGPKSIIEVREGMTFLDLSVRQIEHLNSAHNVNVPFILMNSFNTDDDTARIIQKYANHRIELMTFNQSRYPRVNKETLLPTPKSAVEDKGAWYPPGHGDLFDAIMNSGLVDKLLASGKEYLFVSNVDNLGAVVDTRILEHMHSSGAEFLMEVTDKTKADVKGGTLINYEGNVRLLEIAQVPNDHVEDFKSVRKFKIFNTNNLWINLRAIKRIMENDGMDLEIIVNHKQSDKGEAVIQLETAVGAAIKHFNNAHGINVPRSRFLPVKSCSDLLLITSDLYQLEHGQLRMNPSRMFQSTPVVKLGDHFKKVSAFQKRFKTIPSLLELDHLTVAGDVSFGRAVTLRGTVIIVANDGQRIELPDGTTLENKLVSGHLKLTDLIRSPPFSSKPCKKPRKLVLCHRQPPLASSPTRCHDLSSLPPASSVHRTSPRSHRINDSRTAMESLGGFATTPISTPSRTSTPTPAQPEPESPTRQTTTAAQGLEKEVASVMAGFGSFWGRVKKQGTAALQTAEKQYEAARADFTPLLTQARSQLDHLSEQTRAELQRLSEVPAPTGGSGVVIGADGVPVILDEVPAAQSKVDKGKGVDREGEGEADTTEGDAQHQQTPAAAASAWMAKFGSSLASNPNVKDLSRNLSSLQSNLSTNLHQIQSQLSHIDLAEGQKVAEGYLHKGEAWFQEFSAEVGKLAKDAVKVVPPTTAGGAGAAATGRTSLEGAAMNRRDLLLYKLRTDPAVFVLDPAQPPADSTTPDLREPFASYLSALASSGGFDSPSFRSQVGAELQEAGEPLRKTLDEVVPAQLSEEAFWTRYFFRKARIEEEEERRKKVLQVAEQSEDDFSWDMDDEETASSAASPRLPSTSPAPAAAQPVSLTVVAAASSATPEAATPVASTAQTPAVHDSPVAEPSPRASSDGTSSYDMVSAKSGNPSGDEAAKEAAAVKEEEEDEDSDWE
ncbi:putative UTP--glucose-1-phosphate uridylyltransferase [Rhodotorula toruloides]|nr:putative UTP--glucose-1-phosphate uridylyltransferase [Rhodotorula toruloides]